MPDQQEVLVVRGRLDRRGVFTPGRSRSTPHVRAWPKPERGEVAVELLDEGGRVVNRAWADVRQDVDCQPGEPERWRVEAYIALRDDATQVQLRRDDIVLWRDHVGEQASLSISLDRGDHDQLVLSAEYSRPREHASLLVVYQWGERRFQPVYVGEPRERIDIDASGLPGGERVRLVVTYSDGLRSASAATPWFDMPRRGPIASITRPGNHEEFVAGAPVVLEGGVLDRERSGGPRPEEDLVWRIDGEEVARGPISSVDGLAEGRHKVELLYTAEPGAEASVLVTAIPSREATARDWPDWDPFAD